MTHLVAVLPKKEVLDQWEEIKDPLAWAKVPEDLLKKICNELGEDEVPSMAVLAAVEVADVKRAMGKAEVTAIKRTRLNLLLNALRQKFAFPLVDYTQAEGATQPKQAGAESNVEAIDALLKSSQAKASAAAGATIAVAHVLDQTSSEQLTPLPSDEIDKLRDVLHTKLDGEPLEAETFTDEQITVFKKRVDSGGSPACDYAVLGPYGNRMERKMKFTAKIIDSTGQERTVEIAGPDSLDTWECCHQVFRNLCLACSVARSSTLDNYKARFKERCSEFSGQWGLAMAAEFTCRNELWPRLRSQHKRMHDNPDTKQFSLYDPAMPWESAIAASIVDNEFWGRYFERRALKALMTARPGQPIHAVADDGQPPAKAPRQRPPSRRDLAWLGTGDGRRPDGRLYWDGQYKFCAEYHLDGGCQSQCPLGLSHRCEFCLAWHRSVHCSEKPKDWKPPDRQGKGSKGKGKSGKGKGKKGGGKASYRSW